MPNDIADILLHLTPADSITAKYCTIGVRAGNAIKRLVNEYGFKSSNLYNGQGIDQWEEAGYSLVDTDEVPSNCNKPHYQCKTCNSTNEEKTNNTALAANASNSNKGDLISNTCTKDENGVIQFEASSGVRATLAQVMALFFVAISFFVTVAFYL